MQKPKLINDALMLAIKAHGTQRRKYTGEPYVIHPIGVSKIVETVKHTPEMVAAALLHDVVEDTPVTLKEIRDQFGPLVAEYVHYATNVSEKNDGNRTFRKKMDADHFAMGPAESQTIKIADLIHNSDTIIEHDQKFFHSTYKYEKKYMLEVLTKADPILVEQAQTILQNAWEPTNNA
jgi:(p)ppGpp synthase/HD superfamily hydrolase